METPQTPAQNDPTLGVPSRTDVGGTTGTQADANAANVPASQLPPDPAPQTADSDPGALTEQNREEFKPGQPLGESAPSLDHLQYQRCPNCGTGVLYVTRYDPQAEHEQAQGTALGQGRESGGGYEVTCFFCSFSESRAFNPGQLWGRP